MKSTIKSNLLSVIADADAVHVYRESTKPLFSTGDRLVIDLDRKPLHFEFAQVRLNDGRIVVRQYMNGFSSCNSTLPDRGMAGTCLALLGTTDADPDGESYFDRFDGKADFEVLGTLCGIIHDGQRTECNPPAYPRSHELLAL